MISALLSRINGAWMVSRPPSTPALVASAPSRSKARMKAGRQSG